MHRGVLSTVSLPTVSSAKDISVQVLIETNEHFFPNDQSGRTQIPCGTKHHPGQHRIVRTILAQVNFRHLLSLGNKQTGFSIKQSQRLCVTVTHFAGINFLSHFHITRRKKLLRTGARCSALAVVTPPNRFSHKSCFLNRSFQRTVKL